VTDREEAEALRVELDRHRAWSEAKIKEHAAQVAGLEAALKLVRLEREEARRVARDRADLPSNENGVTMSDLCSKSANQETFVMDLLDKDAEGWARLSGLLAMLGLPPTRLSDGTYRRRAIEIEVKPNTDRWVLIDGVTIEHHRIICWWGSNGTRVQYEYVRGEQMPKWRTPTVVERAGYTEH
jgi:hypothetical protein